MLLPHGWLPIESDPGIRNGKQRSPRRNESCKFSRFSIIKTLFTLPNHPMSVRILLGLSLLLLSLSAGFGFLNASKVMTLRTEQGSDITARAFQRKQTRGTQANVADNNAKIAEAAAHATNAEAELAKAQKEKAALQSKLEANESELAQLQKRVQDLTPDSTQDTPQEGPSVTDLQAQLDEALRQLDSSEREKSWLTEKTQVAQQRSPHAGEERAQRRNFAAPIGVHGAVLAVNRAYNFVVLNLGEHQGVETNAEMLVMRDGARIGKIRVSSVEPATAIGDIISSSLSRGVQVQLGDTVIYAGPSS
jgi:hypothetical protein